MTQELREAAERAIVGYESPSRNYWCDTERGPKDAADLARAYLAEHPADDDEPIDIDWLNSLRREGGNMSFLRVRYSEDGSFSLMSPCKVPTEGIEGIGDYVSPRPSTRGDVRRLCSALGISLKEPTQ